VEDIRIKYISGDVTLEEAIELQTQDQKRQEEEKKVLAEKQEETDKHGIIVEDIRTKYISGDITLEEAIELQKEEEQKRKEAEDAGYEVTLETYSCTIVEKVVGSVEISEIVDAILSGESWNDFIEDKWYDYDGTLHVYGTTDLASSVNFSESVIQDKWDEDGDLDISDDVDKDEFDIDNLEKGNYKYLLDSQGFIHTAESWEKGNWNTYSIDIDGEFDPGFIKPCYEGGLICGYEYDGEEMHNNQDTESRASHTDISIYLITKDGSLWLDFYEIRSNMTEKGLDSENEDDIYKYLKDEYGVE
jgi:hypothetical protein